MTDKSSFIAKPRRAGRANISSNAASITGKATPDQRKRMAAADARAAKADKPSGAKATVRTQQAALAAGANTYRRDDGTLMVEITPGSFVAHHATADDEKPVKANG